MGKIKEVSSSEEAIRKLNITQNMIPKRHFQELDDQGFTVFKFTKEDWLRRNVDLEALTQRIEEIIQDEGAGGGKESNKYITNGPNQGRIARKDQHVEPGAQRLSNLINKDEIFLSLSFLPEILLCSKYVIKGEIRLSSFDMREPLVGCKEQNIHTDIPSDLKGQRPSEIQCVSFLYLDDSTLENSPLRVFPGSHKSYFSVEELENETKIIVPKGSLLIMNANLRHSGTKKNLDLRRRVLFINYRDRRFRQQLNTKLFLDKKTITRLSASKNYLLGTRKSDSKRILQTWAYYNRHDWYIKILIRLKNKFTNF